MQINSTVNQAINKQIGMEFSAYLQYLTISTHFDVEGLSELASFFKAQAEDERDHAERFINHVVAFNGKLEIPTINAPTSNVKSIEEAANNDKKSLTVLLTARLISNNPLVDFDLVNLLKIRRALFKIGLDDLSKKITLEVMTSKLISL